MDRMILDTSDSPVINISSIDGSLRLKGWDRPQIRADIEIEDTLNMDADENTVAISCQSGCLLRVPNNSSLVIGTIANDLVIKSIDGPIEVENVNGQISVKSIGSFSCNKTHGNLNVKHLEGSLTCGKITGNANVQDVEGNVTLKSVNGNISFSGSAANLEANVNGKATLELEPESEGIYKISAKGGITYHVEPFTNATISMSSKGGNIRLALPENTKTITDDTYELILGEGDSQISLEAAGNIEITGRNQTTFESHFVFEDFSDINSLADDISQIVTEQIEDQMASISQHISELTGNLSSNDFRTSENTRRKLEAQHRNLKRKLASVERKARQKAHGEEKRAEHRIRYRSQMKPSDPVSDEERQKVLEMLQSKQISVPDAEILLAALEGRSPEVPEDSEPTEKTEA